MGKGGFEPPRPRAHDPKSCSSASSDTSPRSKSTGYVNRVNQLPQKVNQKLTNSLSDEMVTRFLESRSPGLSKHTITFYQTCLNKAVGTELTPQGITDFLHSLNCGNAKHAYYRALRAICGWLYVNGCISNNPITLVPPPKTKRKLLSSPTEKDVDRIINSASYLRDKCLVSLAFSSGLRLSELARIDVSDIEFENMTIRGKRQSRS